MGGSKIKIQPDETTGRRVKDNHQNNLVCFASAFLS